jgi:hypothetical protein
MDLISFNHNDNVYMKNFFRELFSKYNNRYNELNAEQNKTNDFGVIWSDYFLEYKPLFSWIYRKRKTKIYKKMPKNIYDKYVTKLEINKYKCPRPYYCYCIGKEKITKAQFYIFNEFKSNDLLILFYKLLNNKMELEMIDMNIYNLDNNAEIIYNYSYGYFHSFYEKYYFESDLYCNFKENEPVFLKNEYIYENNLLSKVIRTGDEKNKYKLYYHGKKLDTIFHN